MTHLIDKDALVAEIRKRFDEYSNSILKHYDACKEAKAQELGKILIILDSLNMKEVDFEEELKNYCNDYYNCDYPKQLEEETCSEVMPHIVSAAKHFFELGLKAQKG